jgi:hypothetical protein
MSSKFQEGAGENYNDCGKLSYTPSHFIPLISLCCTSESPAATGNPRAFNHNRLLL